MLFPSGCIGLILRQSIIAWGPASLPLLPPAAIAEAAYPPRPHPVNTLVSLSSTWPAGFIKPFTLQKCTSAPLAFCMQAYVESYYIILQGFQEAD